MAREKLGSRLGFILLSAGCAIGIGNVWKFPYMAGQYGGGLFVLIYIFFLVVMGLPIMTMEFAVGRASQKSPLKAFKVLEKPNQKWHLHGYACIAGNYILMMFYTVVAGWMLHYFYLMASGEFENNTASQISEKFTDMVSSPSTLTFWMVIIVALGFFVCSIGVQKGLERVTKVMMVALLAIMVVLAINSIFLDGGSQGLKFYLIPSLESVRTVGDGNLVKGFGEVIVGAMNQSFFTLSLGIGSMAIFGSYIGKERSLLGESVNIAVLDTFVAITSGLIIFPACFAYGVEPNSGPPLIFETLPNIFVKLPFGRVLGSLFFVFLTFAAFSTVLAVFENIISCVMDLTGWSRKKTCLINTILMIVLSMPCVLGFNLLSGFTPFGAGSNLMDLEDFAVSNIILPIGALVFLLFCTSRYGWGWKNFKEEANQGKGLKVFDGMRVYVTYILPIIVLFLFAFGIYSKFAG